MSRTGPTTRWGCICAPDGCNPLLNRKEEKALAERLETARLAHRRSVLCSWRTVARVVELFERVHAGKTHSIRPSTS
jgi:hypothetical protein